jgi:deoxyribonuclease V
MSLEFDPFPVVTERAPGAYARAWKPVQLAIASRVVVAPLASVPRFIAAADCAFSKTQVFAIALVWDRHANVIVDLVSAVRPLNAPYISGYLTFREGPAILEAIRRLMHPFEVITFDGQGVAHPRRCGLATHMGVTLGLPSIGVAKSRLIGTHADLPEAGGSTSPLMDAGQTIGVVLRTRDRLRPVYVSVGHRVDLPSAVAVVRACVTRYRIPEPTRIADLEVAKFKRAAASNADP